MQKHRNNWLDIFAGFRIAFSFKKILLGATGLYVTLLVFAGLLYLCAQWNPEMGGELDHLLRWHPAGERLDIASAFVQRLCAMPLSHMVAVAAGMFVIMVAIWSFFGGAICRLAAVEFATDEPCPMNRGVRFAARRYASMFWSPLVPCLVCVVLLLCASVVGVIGRIPFVGVPLMGILSFVAAFLSGIALLVLICAVFGLIFSWPTIAAEGTNAFDAVSRSFNYILARPWKTLWCCLMSLVHGVCCLAFVAAFTWVALKLMLASLAFGLGAEAFAPVAAIADFSQDLANAEAEVSSWTLTYFIIRRDVDGVDMDEVYLPQPEEQFEPEPQALETEQSKEKQSEGEDIST